MEKGSTPNHATDYPTYHNLVANLVRRGGRVWYQIENVPAAGKAWDETEDMLRVTDTAAPDMYDRAALLGSLPPSEAQVMDMTDWPFTPEKGAA